MAFLPPSGLRFERELATKFYWKFGSTRLSAPDTQEERHWLNSLYTRFIDPFKQHATSERSDASDHDPPTAGAALATFHSNAVDPTLQNFTSTLHLRDGICFSCWIDRGLDTVPIISHKSSTSIPEILERVGLDSVHRVQNDFSALRQYFDVTDSRLIAKVVNLTNDPSDRDYRHLVFLIRHCRVGQTEEMDICADRNAVDAQNELPVYFATREHPNRTDLAFHKAACLIRKVAGAGNDVEDDFMETEVEDRLQGLGTENESSHSS
ncbi:hypothetical protein BJ741DRAFT_693331 [Chytriomyces cf. hyalinus JEL632]|nr:hypothetical protein BJ741DRAFT_693331 [Chytriomyces cf. hyalinus JEL632]